MIFWLLACPSDGPPPLSEWTGCLYEHARLEVDPTTKAARPVAGEKDVFAFSVRWGGVPWVMDTEQFASLVVEVEPGWPQGQRLEFERVPTDFAANGEPGEPVRGEFRVMGRNERTVDVEVDGVAGGMVIRGRVEVARGCGVVG